MPFGPIVASTAQTVIFSNIRAGSVPTVHNNSMALIIGNLPEPLGFPVVPEPLGFPVVPKPLGFPVVPEPIGK